MKNKLSIAMTLALILAMLVTSLALADALNGDALATSPGQQDVINQTVSGGETVTYQFAAWIAETGNGGDDVFASSGDYLDVTITRAGDWLNTSSGTPNKFAFTDYNSQQTGTIVISVPCDSVDTLKEMTVLLNASPSSNGNSLDKTKQTVTLKYRITAGENGSNCASSNTPPEVTVDNDSVTVDEGNTATNTGTYFDANGGTVSLSASIGDIVDNNDGTWDWSFDTTDGPAESQTVTITADDGQAQGSATFDLTVNNAAPVVTASWATTSVACRQPATLNFGFSDAGVSDNPWTVDIDWDDSSSHYYDNAVATQGTFSQSHTYNMPGTYTATVGVTDKDAGFGSNTADLEVLQTYTVKFLQPFDGSSPSNLITNTMKSGRTVPVKVTIYDDCAQAYVTDPTTMVKIFLSTGSFTGSSNDAVEVYADAGVSNGDTLYFRWTSDTSAPGGGFWIYNLNSKTALNGAALVVSATYRIDVFVGDVKATATTWALLKPVK